MCDLIGIVGLAISAASSVAGYMGQVQAAKDQNQMYRQNAENANKSAINKYTLMQQRMVQEQQAAGEEKIEAAREARAARATAAVAASDANVSGLSVQGLMQEFYGREGSYRASVDRQTEWSLNQMNQEMKGVQAEARDRIDSVQRARRPSFFDAALRIAGAGFDSYSGYVDRQRTAAAL